MSESTENPPISQESILVGPNDESGNDVSGLLSAPNPKDVASTHFGEYDPRSREFFNAAKHEIDKLLYEMNYECEFVGSSAMEGMPGKGSIDIMVMLKDADKIVGENVLDKDGADIVTPIIQILTNAGLERPAINHGWKLSPPSTDTVFMGKITLPDTSVNEAKSKLLIIHIVPPTSPRAMEFTIIKWLGDQSEFFRIAYATDKRAAIAHLTPVKDGAVDRVKYGEKKRKVLFAAVRIIREMANLPPEGDVYQIRKWIKEMGSDTIRKFEERLQEELDKPTP